MSVTLVRESETVCVGETTVQSWSGHCYVSDIACSSTAADVNHIGFTGSNVITSGTDQMRCAFQPPSHEACIGCSKTRTAHVRKGSRGCSLASDANAGALRVSAMHARSKSEAVVHENPAFGGAGPRRASRRDRTLSAAGFAGHPTAFPYRSRAPSPLLSVLSPSTPAPAVLHTPRDESQLLGSFTPTTSSRPTLRSLLSTGHRAHSFSRWRASDKGLDVVSPDTSSQESSPSHHSLTIPCICRTPSSYVESEYFPSAPSSEGPLTPARELSPSPVLKHAALHPVLESLEDNSKFTIQASCTTCGKSGANFPRCPRCGEMWCSRSCRLESSGGKKHVCLNPA